LLHDRVLKVLPLTAGGLRAHFRGLTEISTILPNAHYILEFARARKKSRVKRAGWFFDHAHIIISSEKLFK
jgi:hypothetical protein